MSPVSDGASAPDFQNAKRFTQVTAASKSADFETERPDWALFGNLDTLGQKAGVPAAYLRRLALKELVDNALDAGADVSIKEIEGGSYVIEDNGPGIGGDPQQVAGLFSIDRPLRSSKQWRRPQRGALGNGLRVVAGSLIASGGGRLVVTTRGHRLEIEPRDDGGASVKAEPGSDIGTKIEIAFGPFLPKDESATIWAKQAIKMSRAGGPEYGGKSSPHWYDAQSFYDLIHWSGQRPVRDLIANLDGCSGAAAGQITAELKGRTGASLTRSEATALLLRARVKSRAPNCKRLGAVGDVLDGLYYASKTGIVELGGQAPKAELPFIVEAWAKKIGDERGHGEVTAYVNRTRITGDVHIIPDGKVSTIWGCGINASLEIPVRGHWSTTMNLTAPFVPITTDGKEPDLGLFEEEIVDAISLAIRRAQKAAPKATGVTVKEAVWSLLHNAVVKGTNGGRLTMGKRQVMYKVRQPVFDITGKELTTKNFDSILTQYENEHGEFGAVYRDNRGVLYTPGAAYDIPVGTVMSRGYKRPAWAFGSILYIEKQALFESLKAEKWPERYDCALITGKGFATRAVKDILDNLVEHHEPIRVFCIHDGDSAGTLIYETLQNATPARAARPIEIVNLGLEPWEARDMGLPEEGFEEKAKRRPVAKYVKERPDGAYWEKWLQTKRYELDAMDTVEFIEWLTGKFDEHRVRKVIPTVDVIMAEAEKILAMTVRDAVRERILREADFETRTSAELAAIKRPTLTMEDAEQWVADNPTENWRGYPKASVEEIIGDE